MFPSEHYSVQQVSCWCGWGPDQSLQNETEAELPNSVLLRRKICAPNQSIKVIQMSHARLGSCRNPYDELSFTTGVLLPSLSTKLALASQIRGVQGREFNAWSACSEECQWHVLPVCLQLSPGFQRYFWEVIARVRTLRCKWVPSLTVAQTDEVKAKIVKIGPP